MPEPIIADAELFVLGVLAAIVVVALVVELTLNWWIGSNANAIERERRRLRFLQRLRDEAPR